jgi:hypothetical protein
LRSDGAFLVVRRLIAVLGMLTLTVAYVPSLVNDLGAAAMPSCCSGTICPLHHRVAQHVVCDMDGHPSATLESCPGQVIHYASALPFVRIAPPTLAIERLAGPAPVFVPPALLNVAPDVAFPPPRTTLA